MAEKEYKFSRRPGTIKDIPIVQQIAERELLPPPIYPEGQGPANEMEFYADRAAMHMIEAEWLYRELMIKARALLPNDAKALYTGAFKVMLHIMTLSLQAAVRMRLKAQDVMRPVPPPADAPRDVRQLSDTELARVAGRMTEESNAG